MPSRRGLQAGRLDAGGWRAHPFASPALRTRRALHAAASPSPRPSLSRPPSPRSPLCPHTPPATAHHAAALTQRISRAPCPPNRPPAHLAPSTQHATHSTQQGSSTLGRPIVHPVSNERAHPRQCGLVSEDVRMRGVPRLYAASLPLYDAKITRVCLPVHCALRTAHCARRGARLLVVVVVVLVPHDALVPLLLAAALDVPLGSLAGVSSCVSQRGAGRASTGCGGD